MYFHDASTEALLTSSEISIAEVIVVASIATHISPTLLVVTAQSIVNANRLTKIWKRRARRGSSADSRPGPSHTASAATTDTHAVRRADSPSTRKRSCQPATTTRPAAASPARTAAARTDKSESAPFVHPTARR